MWRSESPPLCTGLYAACPGRAYLLESVSPLPIRKGNGWVSGKGIVGGRMLIFR